MLVTNKWQCYISWFYKDPYSIEIIQYSQQGKRLQFCEEVGCAVIDQAHYLSFRLIERTPASCNTQRLADTGSSYRKKQYWFHHRRSTLPSLASSQDGLKCSLGDWPNNESVPCFGLEASRALRGAAPRILAGIRLNCVLDRNSMLCEERMAKGPNERGSRCCSITN